MSRIISGRHGGSRRLARALLVVAATAAFVTFGGSAAAPALADSSGDLQANVPYSLPVASLPTAKTSPAVDPAAPYTPLVLSLIRQLEPDNPPTAAELANASLLLHDGPNGSCHNVGPVSAPTGTTPSIAPICWTDAQGVLNTSGPNARGSTAPDDADGPRFHVRPLARQRLGPDGGHREPRVHGHRPVRPADRPRPAAELGPQPDHHRRGSVPQPRARRGADQRHAGRRRDVADEALRRLQRPEPER